MSSLAAKPHLIPPSAAPMGRLDGRIIFRFAHAYESGGGTERYLDDLDNALLERNRMTIVRMHITRQTPVVRPPALNIGRGQLIRIPLPVHPSETKAADTEEGSGGWLKEKLRDWFIYNPLVWAAYGARKTRGYRLPAKPGQAIAAGAATAEVLKTLRVDAAMLHFFGGADADEVMTQLAAAGVPFGLLNHFANDRFLHLSIRKHVMHADGVAGVNGRDLPSYVRAAFVNLADGIDVEFFRKENARPVAAPADAAILLLPARITREKGQLDLIRIAGKLKRAGTPCRVAFAGRVDGSSFVDELNQLIAAEGLADSVSFLGALGLEELRNWYAASSMVVLPTYHHEGLPRIILEAQAMHCPVVAYSTGGVADGIEHGRTGFLHKTGDLNGMFGSVRKLLLYPGLRAEFGSRGRRQVETHFSLSSLATRHENFYAALMAKRAAAR
jgi:glycosyltransferase involved in cell wall biosynthesis